MAEFLESFKDSRPESHSSEVSEIMGYVPHWIVRWGIATFLIVIVALLAGSWLVKYPDVVVGAIEITSTNPPAYLKARSTVKIRHLLVQDHQEVTAGQYLVVLENTADYRHILAVKEKILEWRDRGTDSAADLESREDFRTDLSMGSIRSDYSDLLDALREYRQFLELQHYGRSLESLRNQLEQQRRYHELQQQQVELLEADCELSRTRHERTRELFDSGLESEAVFEQSRSSLLQKEHSLAGGRLNVAATDLQIVRIEQSLDEALYDSLQTRQRLESNLLTARDDLYSHILDWEQMNILKAPMDGLVSMIGFWSEGQNVSAGDKVIAILPQEPAGLVGKVLLPRGGAGRVAIGQRVNVKLDHYPYEEFGSITGVVASMSQVPEEQGYVVSVVFPDGLRASHGRQLPFSQYLSGSAEIITDDLRLFWRLFNHARSFAGAE